MVPDKLVISRFEVDSPIAELGIVVSNKPIIIMITYRVPGFIFTLIASRSPSYDTRHTFKLFQTT